MTTIADQPWICPLCETESAQQYLMSTNTLGGSTDIDSRPGGMARATLQTAVWSCPECGFAAPPTLELGAPADEIRDLVRGDAYKAQREDERHPALANSSLCRAAHSVGEVIRPR